MIAYAKMSAEERKAEYARLQKEFEELKASGLNLNMARGKPAKAQLDAVSDILTVLLSGDDCLDGNIDARNYGELAGLPAARKYWADVLGCKPEQTFLQKFFCKCDALILFLCHAWLPHLFIISEKIKIIV